jgi:benzodiazapine receptor
MKNVIKFLVSIIVCQLAGGIGSIFTANSVGTWYADLIKPSFSPPNWLFAPVWILLYFLMGISLFLVWSKGKRGLPIFFIQLVVNAFWSIAFFGLKSPLFGLIVIIILWVLILLTIIKFFKISKLAAWLLIPYIAWVTFATILNFSIWILNI